MRLAELENPPARPAAGLERATVETDAGSFTVWYDPARAVVPSAGFLTVLDLIEGKVTAWDVTDGAGRPVPLSADALSSLSPAVQERILLAITPAPEARDGG